MILISYIQHNEMFSSGISMISSVLQTFISFYVLQCLTRSEWLLLSAFLREIKPVLCIFRLHRFISEILMACAVLVASSIIHHVGFLKTLFMYHTLAVTCNSIFMSGPP